MEASWIPLIEDEKACNEKDRSFPQVSYFCGTNSQEKSPGPHERGHFTQMTFEYCDGGCPTESGLWVSGDFPGENPDQLSGHISSVVCSEASDTWITSSSLASLLRSASRNTHSPGLPAPGRPLFLRLLCWCFYIFLISKFGSGSVFSPWVSAHCVGSFFWWAYSVTWI